MSFLFGGEDKGPTEAEVLAKQVSEAKKRRSNLRNIAVENQNKGVTQLLGQRNTSLKLPGSKASAGGLSGLLSGLGGVNKGGSNFKP